MAIFLRESDVEALSSMKMAIEAVEQAFRLQGEEKVCLTPRRRCHFNNKGMLQVMSSSLPTLGYAGLKSYTSLNGVFKFMVLLYKEDGQLVAMMEADKLGQLRTGATSAVATKYMARKESAKLGVFGAGWQAKSQIEAICSVLPIKNVIVYSKTAEKLQKFCQEMTETSGIEVRPATTPEEAVKGMDIVVTATTSYEPVFKGEWLSKGTHVNAIGSNFPTKQEIDVETVKKCACVVVDSCEQAMLECGDLTIAAKAGAFYWEDGRDLGLVVVGEFPGREDADEITLFESQGISLEDVALAVKV